MPFTKEANLYNLFHQDKDYAKEAAEIRKHNKKALTVLEIGCGTGLLTKELVKQGFIVTVIEPSIDMLKQWRLGGVRRINKKLQDVPADTFAKKEFDLVIAYYDVLNYIPSDYQEGCVGMLMWWGRKFIYEVWPAAKGVKLFTLKRAEGWTRIRLGIKIKNTAHLLFIYFGKGFVLERHTLYL